MDFDPKCFFENPPRMKEDLKEYIKDLSKKIVEKIRKFSENLCNGERISSKHVKLILFALCPEPITVYNRQGLCTQNFKMKPIYRVLIKAIDEAVQMIETDKYGGIEKKIVKGTQHILKSSSIKYSLSGAIAVAATVSTICGILLQSSVDLLSDAKTLNYDSVRTNGVYHKSSSGQIYPYSSLIKFLNIIEILEPLSVEANKKDKKNKESIKYNREPLKVHFQAQKFTPDKNQQQRPSTPDNCFWED